MENKNNIVNVYMQNVIKKSYTWSKLTEEEKRLFSEMDIFEQIKGSNKQKIEWLNTIYKSFLVALGYKPVGWREEETPQF